VCILAFVDRVLEKQTTFITKNWRKADEALEDFMTINFRDEIIPANFKRTFLQNYLT